MFENKRILITGGLGSIGKELVKQLLTYEPQVIRILDNRETELFFFQEKYRNNKRMRFFLGDIRDEKRLMKAFENVDFVFHLAGLKHVLVCEYNPFEAIQTNLLGVQNVINCALDVEPEKVIFTSSDKAVNPTNVMGATKLMAERLITAANAIKGGRKSIFSSIRFGNVIGSAGSAVHIFKDQILKGEPVTITDNEMTRFVMTVQEAVKLILNAANLAKGGEVFIMKMPVIRILDLIKILIEELSEKALQIKEIGPKPGEKLYEELMTNEEVSRTIELDDLFVTVPAVKFWLGNIDYEYENTIRKTISKAYVSNSIPPMNKNEIKAFLKKSNLL